MKIVCESCSAKYSIADEKVAGKVFKIRCKRCSEVIVVRGDQDQAPAADNAQAFDYGADAIWHVVVEGEQAGPYAPSQLGEMLTAGTIDWDAYVWCEGFDNWLPMRDVEDLVAQVTGESAGPAQAAAATATASAATAAADGAIAAGGANADLFGDQPSMGADPFAEESGSVGGGGMFDGGAAASASAGGGDLFGGQAEASPFDGGMGNGGVVASAPSPRVSTEQAMTGARNENSVLFSLKNLQALATGSNTPSAPPSGAGAAQAPGGFATGEGSGLIDIRALASATGVADGQASDGEKDELLSMSSQTGAFGSLGSPMLAPAAEEPEGGGKTRVVAIMAGVGMLCVAAVAVAWILKPEAAPPAPPAVAAATGANPGANAQAAATPEPEQPAEAEAPSEGELAAQKAAAAAKEAQGSGDGDRESRRQRRQRSGSSSSAKAAADKPAAPQPESKPEAKKKKSGPRSLDDLLDSALTKRKAGSSRSSSSSSSSDSSLPEKPSRDQVVRAMNGVKSAVEACGKGASGVAFANVTVKGSTGRVTSANITGQTGTVGSCIARAVRKARFPKFKSSTFKVKFPFRL